MKFILPAALLPVVLAIACNNAASRKAKVDEAASTEQLNTRLASVESANNLSNADSVAVRNDEQPNQQPAAPGKKQTTGVAHTLTAANPDWDKKIVKTADVSVEVKDFKGYTGLLYQKVRAAGGYIAREEQNGSVYKIENNITIKVPVDRFDETVLRLASDSDKLVSKKISAEDVTMQLVDTKSRLETRKEVRQRYLELLKQAHSMKDILQVQNEINQLQEEMDGAAGRIAYLGHAAAYSTINLNFYQVLDASVRNDVEPSFLHKVSGAFKDGWNWFSALTVGLVGLWPLLLAGLLAVMWWRKRPHSLRQAPASSITKG